MEKSDRSLAEEVKKEWRQLWLWRIDDKVRAEGVSSRTFRLCFVEQGTVIVATRDYKPLDLKAILRANQVQNVERVVGPLPSEGGWRKFSRMVLNRQERRRRVASELSPKERVKNLQLKKGGRGWVHRLV